MAGKLDLDIEQGATFTRVFTWQDAGGEPVDLTGYAARLQVRETHGSLESVLDLSSPSAGLELGGAAGTITLTITASQTADIVVADDGSDTPVRALVYDLELANGAFVKRLLAGAFTVSKEVTR